MKLYKHQEYHLNLNKPKWAILDGTGGGKTVTALALAKKNNVTPLIIVPKPVIQKWKDACETMGVNGSVIGREQFRIHAKDLAAFPAVIVDESHAVFGNHKSQGHKKLATYIKKHNVQYVWLLTATIYTSSPWSIYAQARLIGHEWNYIKFRDAFFVERYLGKRVIWEPRAGTEKELGQLVARIGHGVALADCFDVPEQIFEVERFETTKDQDKAFEMVKKTESDAVVRVTKNHQIASGTLKGNEFTETTYYDALKNDQILSYAEQNKKMVVFSRYNAHLEQLAWKMEKADIPFRIVNGTIADKELVFRECEAADRMVVLINSMISVGYELPSFPLMIFASLSFSYVDFQQGIGRILRANALKKNVYKTLLTKGTIDEAVYDSIKRKENFNAEIYIQMQQ